MKEMEEFMFLEQGNSENRNFVQVCELAMKVCCYIVLYFGGKMYFHKVEKN